MAHIEAEQRRDLLLDGTKGGAKAKEEDPDSTRKKSKRNEEIVYRCWIDRQEEEKGGRTDGESRIVNRLNYYRDFGSFGGGERSRGPKRARLER